MRWWGGGGYEVCKCPTVFTLRGEWRNPPPGVFVQCDGQLFAQNSYFRCVLSAISCPKCRVSCQLFGSQISSQLLVRILDSGLPFQMPSF